MSLAINRAKYTGDPGLFGDIFRGAAGAVGGFFSGGPMGAVSGGYRGLKGTPQAGPGGTPTHTDAQLRGALDHARMGTKLASQGGPSWFTQSMLDSATARFAPRPAPGLLAGVQRFVPGGATGMLPAANGAGAASMGGYHLNKSSYFLRSGEFVPAGSKWVRNRKRNPANARATSRAISRVTGAKRYASSLSRISIRKKKC